MRVFKACASASKARPRSPTTVFSTSPVKITVPMNASSSKSEVPSGADANGPRPSIVCHTAMMHTSAFSAVTSRHPKRRAVQITNGRIVNVSGSEGRVGAHASPKIA